MSNTENENFQLARVADPDNSALVGNKLNVLDRIVDSLITFARTYHWDKEVESSTCLALAKMELDEYLDNFIGKQCSLEIKQKSDENLRVEKVFKGRHLGVQK